MRSVLSPFDPEAFRTEGHAVVDVLADHLAEARIGRPSAMPVLPWVEPDAMVGSWPGEFPGGDSLSALVGRIVAQSNHLHHPHYIGHQVTSPLPSAALVELTSALLNNGSAVYEMGPASIAMERRVLSFLASRVGFPRRDAADTGETSKSGADGVLTSGGSAGNLTALLAARQAMAGYDAWNSGAHGGPPLAVLTSDQTHYCVRRAVQIMGWGADGVVSVPSDEAYRLRVDMLSDALDRATAAKRKVIAVVASAASTSTGAIDPLDAIADFCSRRGLWLHVDGAHGASFALSPKLRSRLRGIERADSIVWDAHKMMLLPALITAVIFRDGRRSYEAFSQQASYLFSAADPQDTWFDVGMRTLECTKRMMGAVLYSALAVHGEAYFAEYIESMVALATRFAAMIREAPDFELAVEPECNIVCFRYLGGRDDDRDLLQGRIRMSLLERGSFYVVQTRLRTGVYLRTTLINPQTDEAHLTTLLNAIRSAARELGAL